MRRAILWLDELDWGQIVGWIFGAPVMAFLAFWVLAVLGVPVRAVLGLKIGEPWDCAPYGLVVAVPVGATIMFGKYGWPRLVAWAKTAPAISAPSSNRQDAVRDRHGDADISVSAGATDPFFEAARREVEAIAPENP